MISCNILRNMYQITCSIFNVRFFVGCSTCLATPALVYAISHCVLLQDSVDVSKAKSAAVYFLHLINLLTHYCKRTPLLGRVLVQGLMPCKSAIAFASYTKSDWEICTPQFSERSTTYHLMNWLENIAFWWYGSCSEVIWLLYYLS